MKDNTSVYINNEEIDSYFGQYEFIRNNPGLAIVSIILLSIASIVGTIGNILIPIVMIKMKELKKPRSIFIINLVIADIYVTLIADPMSIVGKVEGRLFFDKYPLVCRIVGKMCTISCIASLGSIAYLSFNRYVYICHNKYYTKIFTHRTCIGMCLLLYGVGLFMVELNSIGIGNHGFDDKSLECIWDRMATYTYTVVFSVSLVWIPLIVIGISYLRLFQHVLRVRGQISDSTMITANVSNASLKVVKTIFIAYSAFAICWIPFAILLIADVNDTFSHELHLCITVFAHFHPSVNWAIYYFTNSKFRKTLNHLIRPESTTEI